LRSRWECNHRRGCALPASTGDRFAIRIYLFPSFSFACSFQMADTKTAIPKPLVTIVGNVPMPVSTTLANDVASAISMPQTDAVNLKKISDLESRFASLALLVDEQQQKISKCVECIDNHAKHIRQRDAAYSSLVRDYTSLVESHNALNLRVQRFFSGQTCITLRPSRCNQTLNHSDDDERF